MFQQVSLGNKEPSSLVAHAALRNRAIQRKRKEIEEVSVMGFTVGGALCQGPERSLQVNLVSLPIPPGTVLDF